MRDSAGADHLLVQPMNLLSGLNSSPRIDIHGTAVMEYLCHFYLVSSLECLCSAADQMQSQPEGSGLHRHVQLGPVWYQFGREKNQGLDIFASDKASRRTPDLFRTIRQVVRAEQELRQNWAFPGLQS